MKKNTSARQIDITPKPFIRWAGGKTWLHSRLNSFLPSKFNNYHEPFLGGGAIFFYLRPANESFLSDLNHELINTYKQIKKSVSAVILHLDKFRNIETEYYKLRSNVSADPFYNAAKFIFLNKTCYNGIYRVNTKGEFNVPYGHNSNVTIYDKFNLLAAKRALTNACIESKDFMTGLDKIEKNDLVFVDPPYTVAHNNNGFVEYNQKIFTWEDQERLANFINEVKIKKAKFILTNAVHDSVLNLYKGIGNYYELERHSTITSHINRRRKISEYLITNCT
ncbi:MAG TPA: Dam family site-specific DNA-(adenine-N6)-methyltransferase [Pyrinomonadaceae bacterium]|jgi:DNA adenine methylase|nr:Dam family site-specific DNA-(adenine-N6)-methyltransferase [Pyrinomonadaceae bacterium]